MPVYLIETVCYIITIQSAAMEILLGIPPLETFIEELARSSCYRLTQLKTWASNNVGHSAILSRFKVDCDLLSMSGDTLVRELCVSRFSCVLPTREQWNDPSTLLPVNAKVCILY